jgi:hypothetical protein
MRCDAMRCDAMQPRRDEEALRPRESAVFDAKVVVEVRLTNTTENTVRPRV